MYIFPLQTENVKKETSQWQTPVRVSEREREKVYVFYIKEEASFLSFKALHFASVCSVFISSLLTNHRIDIMLMSSAHIIIHSHHSLIDWNIPSFYFYSICERVLLFVVWKFS
jgi:hypothetical protein